MPSMLNHLATMLPGRPRARAEQKSTPASLFSIEGLARPAWSSRDYAGYARDGMMRNAIVYRCVRMISEAAASVRIIPGEPINSSESEPHGLLQLLSQPSPACTMSDLFEAWYGTLLLSGNVFVEAVGSSGQVRELHLLRPDRITIKQGRDGWPAGYEYNVDGRRQLIDGEVTPGVSRLLHVKLFHPVNDQYGLSPIEAAGAAIDIHNTATRWNKALLDNAARPSGALVYNTGDHLSDEQFDRLKHELEASFQGARNAGRPLLLEGGLDWKAMSLTPRDMDFIEAKNAAAREIALALGVPPMLLGIPGDNTYANFQEANRSFWRQTVLPLVHRTTRALNMWLAPAFEDQIQLRADIDAIEALHPEREALWRRLEQSSFLSEDEKRAAIGYGPRSDTNN